MIHCGWSFAAPSELKRVGKMFARLGREQSP
jgi:hypothetical protein